ncbi:MAG TPA: class I SAM-dependent methyltransferase [Gemmatimonadaceae bacterium]|nr:class I SAM-dependent methyltransferase [Gemmatimonadaceae bacterium]
MSASAAAPWADWLARWDRFQESYVPHRAAQFDLMLDCVASWWRGTPVRALDLGCGPGSVAARLLHRLPAAEVVALDYDPWLIEMGRRTIGGCDRLTWLEADLRDDAWNRPLRHQEFHAVLTATTLHRFDAGELTHIYRGIATLMVEGGLFLNADVLPTGSPRVMRLTRELLMRWQARRATPPLGESWFAFWQDARRVPAFRALIAERDRRLEPRTARQAPALAFHEDALLAAGFREVGEIWRWHESAILLAIR